MVLEVQHIPEGSVNSNLIDQRRTLTEFVTMEVLRKRSVALTAPSTTGYPRNKSYDQSEEQ
jgi:hypothetical protein